MSSASAFTGLSQTPTNQTQTADEMYSYLNTRVREAPASVLPFGAYFQRRVPEPAPLTDVVVKSAWDRRSGISE
jgi:hypothetical protein